MRTAHKLLYPIIENKNFFTMMETLAVQQDFLQFQDFTAGSLLTSTIYSNRAYTGGVSAELLTNGDFSAWTGTLPSEIPTGWTPAGTRNANNYITNVSSQARIVSDGSTNVQIYQDKLTNGNTHRFRLDINAYVQGTLRVEQPGGTNRNDYTSVGAKTFDMIAGGVTPTRIVVLNTSAAADFRFDNASLIKLSERDLLIANATAVAGLQGQRAGALGTNVVVNGTFDTDTVWSKGTGWTIAAGVATKAAGTGSDLTQTSILTTHQSYRVTFTASGYSAGTLTAKLGTNGPTVVVNANGPYTLEGVANGTGLIFTADSSFAGNIDDVVCRPYTVQGGVYCNGSTTSIKSQGAALDALTNATYIIQFYGTTLASKTLMQKSGAMTIAFDASRKLVVTRNRATTNATATTVDAVSLNAWHELIVTIASDGEIQIYLDSRIPQATTGEFGSGTMVSTANTNPIFWGMDASLTSGIVGVLGPVGVDDAVLTSNAIGQWLHALDGNSYSEPTIDAFLTSANSISGVDVRGWDFKHTAAEVGASAIETVNGTNSPSNPSAEKLTNGNLETWSSPTNAGTWSENLAGSSTVNQETSIVHGGSNAARFDVDGSTSSVNIAQAVTAAIGDVVKTTWWAKVNDATGAPKMRVDLGASGGTDKTLTTEWQQLTQFHVALATNPQIIVSRGSASANKSIYIDDISSVVIGNTAGVLSGTYTQGVAGKRGQNNGAVGANIISDSEMDDTGWWSQTESPPAQEVSFASGKATLVTDGAGAAALFKNSSIVKGTEYQVEIKIDQIDIGGSGQFRIADPSGTPIYHTFTNGQTGTHTIKFTAAKTGFMLWLVAGLGAGTVVVDYCRVKPYTTPSGILADGATTEIEVAAAAMTAFAAATQYGYFGVALAFSDGELDAGRLFSWASVHYLRFNGSGSPRLQSQIDYTTTDAAITMNENLRLNEFFTFALLHDASGANQQELRIGYSDTPIAQPAMTSPTVPSGTYVNPTGDFGMLNLPPSSAVTWDGVLDLLVYFIGFKPSDHIIRWMHNRIFTHGD